MKPTRRLLDVDLDRGDYELAGGRGSRSPLQAVSKHLQVLERAGLVSRGRTAQLRPSRLEPAPLEEAVSWLATYRRFWRVRFDRLDERLREPGDG